MHGHNYKLVQLAQGVYSIRSLVYGETFHPVIGPAAEARALYLNGLRLEDRIRTHQAGEFVIWDVGLGAAANPLTVLTATRDMTVTVRVVSFDQTLEPLRFALGQADRLPFLLGYEGRLQALIRDRAVSFAQGQQLVHWELHLADFPTFLAAPAAEEVPKPHAILFDAHSPARNPEMWTQALLTRIHNLLDPDRPCALATFSRSTMLRVGLLLASFYVGRGYATGEKEETTIAANSLALLQYPLGRDWLRRVRRSTAAEPLWEAVYRQARLSPETDAKLRAHPQFA
jgi:tRNA U34 5-methylaminomethyl-2-thiouridine-forming methyltransferase MnmC